MNERSRARVVVLGVLVLSLVATLVGRLWYVQVLAGPTYRNQAQANQERQVVTPAPRGAIVDDEGRPLANDRYEYVVTVSADTLSRQKDKGAAVLGRLAPILGESVTDLTNKIRSCGAPDPTDKSGRTKIGQPCYTGSPYQPVPVKALDPADTAGVERALVVEERSELFPGVALTQQQVRQYPLGAVAGHELGYLQTIGAEQLTQPQYKGYQATDLIGQSGLEQQYDKQLRGTDAVQTLSVDASGHVTGTKSATPAQAGSTLVLNLDAGLQQAVEKDLAAAIASARRNGKLATTASAVVMDVRTGAVLAMASLPDYDPNQFTGGISTANFAALQDPNASAPLISRAYTANFPPGSTFKLSSSATILQNGLASPSTPVACPGSYRPPGSNQAFANFEGEVIGTIGLTTALAKSCDTYFYQFAYDAWVRDGGLRLNTDTKAKPLNEFFVKMAKALGYGAKTGVDLPNESAGVLFDRAQTAQNAAYLHKQYCAGATMHPDNPAQEQRDASYCAVPLSQFQALTAGDALNFAIGQGGQVNVTVLQQAVAYAAIANGGTLVQPHLAKAFVAPDGAVTPVQPVVTGHVPVSAANIDAIKTGLRAVVGGGGTGSALSVGSLGGLEIAGKTGTADIASKEDDPYGLFSQPESWFASYQPASSPRYVVVGLVEHGGQGANAAAPLVGNIYSDMYGLNGRTAVWPNGQPPTTLPTIASTGAVTAPQTGIIGVVPSPALPGGAPDPQAVALAQQTLAAQKKNGSGG